MEELLAAGYRQFNNEVFYAPPGTISLSFEILDKLGSLAIQNTSGKARICFHDDINAPVHDMVIALGRKVKIKPHLHTKKTELFHIIVGEMNINIFDEMGACVNKVMLNANGTKYFYYKLPPNIIHNVTPLTDLVIFRETTDGPFRPEETIYPLWKKSMDIL